MSRIELLGVSKTFPTRPPVHAVREVDLTVDDGHLMAILGPSGCGKTTLLRMIAGFERPDRGALWIGDEQVASERSATPPERRRVGMVPQHGALFPHLDVSGNVRFALANRRGAQARARAEEMLELVGLAGFGKRKPHELSGGQQQRVALARALAPSPSVVLLDEPFTALDAALRARLQADVRTALRESAATAVMVTHDPAEALAMGDRVAVMREGRIEQVGIGRDLYFAPANETVARALGNVELLAIVGGDGSHVVTPFGPLPLPLSTGDDAVATHASAPTDTASADGWVLVRPEQVALDADAATKATVEDVQFNGPDAVVTLAPAVADAGLPGAGDRVRARWRSDDAPAVGDVVGVAVTGTALGITHR